MKLFFISLLICVTGFFQVPEISADSSQAQAREGTFVVA